MKKTLLIMIIMVLSACSSSSKKPAEKMYYRFPENAIQTIDSLNIDIKRPSAMGILGNRPMVAVTSDAGLVQMSNNFWLDSPKVLLQNYLNKAFVSNPDKEKITLNTQILALEKNQNEAVLSIKFILSNTENTVLFEKVYKNQRTITNNSIASFSRTIGNLLEEMVEQFTNEIK